MKKGSITILQAVVGGIFLLASSIGGAWVTGSAAANEKISATKFDTAQLISAETIARTEAVTRLEGKMDTLNEKMDAVIDGLGIKYSLPKTEAKADTFDTKEERIRQKAPLVKGTDNAGQPINEQGN